MFINCSTMGIAGWLLMIALWGSFLAFSIWTITRLFPLHPDGVESARPHLADTSLRSDERQTAAQPVRP
jgi:hypothetical protein